jgi:hypothetical protein
MSREGSVRSFRGWWIVLALTSSTGCSLLISLDPIVADGDAGAGGNSGAGAGGTMATGGNAGSSPGCPTGHTMCGSQCVDLLSDQSNCGMCASACTGSNRCLGGQCCAPPAAGGECNLPSCGCAAGSVCYPDTEATGLACFPSTGLSEGADCSGSDDVCNSGVGCFSGVCKKYCNSDVDCPTIETGRHCAQTVWSTGDNISGVAICQRTCDPVRPQVPRSPLLACPAGFGCFSAPAPGATDCIPGGAGIAGSACGDDSDCSAGFYCTVNSVCNKYCYTSADCPSGPCTFFGSHEYAGAREVGFCTPP